MERKDYEKLNYYLNGCFKKLEKNDSFLLTDIDILARMSNDCCVLLKKYDFEYYKEENNLTYQDVFMLAREIVESLDENYLPYYDDLIKSGRLDFSYNNDYYDSHWMYKGKEKIHLININRSFNYTDVTTLIHEFMHYMSGLGVLSNNRYLLTEFISIYFEEYAKNYLLNKGISKEELFFNERFINIYRMSSNFNWYNLILLVYEKTGKIDETSYEFLNDYYVKITKEAFDEECQKLLNKFKKKEKEYRMDIMYEEEFSENEMFSKLIKLLNVDYRYVMGTVFAFNALEQSSLDKMVDLCNHINDDKYSQMEIWDILEFIGVKEINLDALENRIIENDTKVK